MGGPQNCSRHFKSGKNFLDVLGIETEFLGHPNLSLEWSCRGIEAQLSCNVSIYPKEKENVYLSICHMTRYTHPDLNIIYKSVYKSLKIVLCVCTMFIGDVGISIRSHLEK